MTPLLAALALASLWCLLWAPFWWCCCAPPECTTTVNVNVKRCGVNASGRSVAVKVGGSTLASGTTDGSGNVTLSPVAVSGTSATVEVTSGLTGYDDRTVSITLTCGTVTVNTSLPLASGYSCTDDSCCPAGGSAPFPIPSVATTLYFTDHEGTVTLTKSGSEWYGCASRTATYAVTLCSFPFPGTSPASINVEYMLSCVGGNWGVSMFAATCSPSLFAGRSCGASIGPYTTGAATLSGTCNSGFSMSGSTTHPGGGLVDRDIYNAAGGGTSVTVTD